MCPISDGPRNDPISDGQEMDQSAMGRNGPIRDELEMVQSAKAKKWTNQRRAGNGPISDEQLEWSEFNLVMNPMTDIIVHLIHFFMRKNIGLERMSKLFKMIHVNTNMIRWIFII